MRLLVDANLAPLVAEELRADGRDVEHVFDVDLGTARDPAIMEYAPATERTIVSSDTDFGTLLARSGDATPSFVLLRHMNELIPVEQVELLRTCLKVAADQLHKGAVVSVRPGRIRVRTPPIQRGPRRGWRAGPLEARWQRTCRADETRL